MNAQPAPKKNIRQPEKWVGKYVRHMANWQDFQWAYGEGYFVCEYTGKLTRSKDEAYWGNVWAMKEQAEAAGYDECFSYCEEALLGMYRKQQKVH